jgi:DNA polymerase-3 subunit epsilon
MRFLGLGAEQPPQVKAHLGLRRRLKLNIPVEEALFVALDTELTGTDLKRDSLVSIGALKMRGGSIHICQDFYRLVEPSTALRAQSVVVHGITHTELSKEAQDLRETLLELLQFLDDAVLVGHFVFIDLNFLNKALKEHFGITLRSPAIDTLSLHRWLEENEPSFRMHWGGLYQGTDLYGMARRYGIQVQGTHNALYDAYLTAQLLQRFLPALKEAGVLSLKELLSVGRP